MEKKKYISPKIELITLDNEISLALESTPPAGPEEEAQYFHETLNENPIKGSLS